jgi:uncharacterized membrane protein SpoIIM required for sporulation
MRPNQLLEARQKEWQRLDELVTRSQSSIQRLSPAEVREMGRLYRAVSSDLALAQRDFPGHRVTLFLNQLVGRAHAIIYRGRPMVRSQARRFFTHDFPRTFRELGPFILVAACFFVIPALLAGLIIFFDPQAAEWLLPGELQSILSGLEDQTLWTDIPVNERPYTSTFIMQNNIQVSIIAFAGGVLAGIPTAWILMFNGLILGGLTGLTANYGLAFGLWTFVIGHGVIELSVIFMAGGAGLSLGWAVFRPGLLSRRDALMLAARKTIILILGGVLLLVIAGLIEGFISPAEGLPWPVKWLVGISSGIALYSYLMLAGRDDKDESEARLGFQFKVAIDDRDR